MRTVRRASVFCFWCVCIFELGQSTLLRVLVVFYEPCMTYCAGGGYLSSQSHGASQLGPASLSERLHLSAADNDPIPANLLRKFVAYARKFVKPRLSAEAKTVLGA